MNHDALLKEAIRFDRGDARRIQHFLKVHAFASLIGRQEHLSEKTQDTLEAAAILHDIGIHAAEDKYGSSAGKYQELEGPAPARQILEKLAYPAPMVERIIFLIAHHHTYGLAEGPDYQILLEADFLVNAYEDALTSEAILAFRKKLFRTTAGTALLDTLYFPAASHTSA